MRLWHMVARVTCLLSLALNFWPLEQNLPTLMAPARLYLPAILSVHPSFGPSLYLACSCASFPNHLCRTGLCPSCSYPLFQLRIQLCPLFLLFHCVTGHYDNDLLSESVIDRIPRFLNVCVFAVCLSRQKAGWAPAIRSPSIHSP